MKLLESISNSRKERRDFVELSRCSYTILGIMKKRNAIDKVHGLTISEISSFEKVSKHNTIHKKVKELQEYGLVNEGVKAGRAKTYYATDKALAILPVKKEESDNV